MNPNPACYINVNNTEHIISNACPICSGAVHEQHTHNGVASTEQCDLCGYRSGMPEGFDYSSSKDPNADQPTSLSDWAHTGDNGNNGDPVRCYRDCGDYVVFFLAEHDNTTVTFGSDGSISWNNGSNSKHLVVNTSYGGFSIVGKNSAFNELIIGFKNKKPKAIYANSVSAAGQSGNRRGCFYGSSFNGTTYESFDQAPAHNNLTDVSNVWWRFDNVSACTVPFMCRIAGTESAGGSVSGLQIYW